MKSIFTALVLLSVFGSAQAAGKLAFINPAVLLTKSPQALAANKKLQDEFLPREQSLKSMQQKLQQMQDDFKKNQSIMSEEEKQKAQSDFVAQAREAQFAEKSFKQDLQERQVFETQTLNQDISKVIQDYGEKNGYDFIFTEGVAYASDAVDITDEILEILKKK